MCSESCVYGVELGKFRENIKDILISIPILSEEDFLERAGEV